VAISGPSISSPAEPAVHIRTGRIPVRPFNYIVKAGQPARRPLQENGEIMTPYLVAIHLPDDYNPPAEDEAMSRDIDALNDESAGM
jgi:hypothetical protein